MSKILANAPLRIVLVVPFMLQTVATVGLVGYLSFRNGQKAVQDITSQLRSELTTHTKQQLESYVKTPGLINQLNVNALTRGEIDIINTKGGDHFWQQAKLFPSTSFVYCGSERGGEFFGVSRGPNKGRELQVAIVNGSTGHRFYYYGVDGSGNRTALIEKGAAIYDARSRPWYRAARTAGGPTWSEIYLDFTWLLPTITASMPVYDKTGKSLLGVCATDLFLPKEFSEFLRSLKIGQSGQIFVVERSGVLVSSSTPEPLTTGSGKDATRLKAQESGNPLVRGTGQYLSDRFGDLSQIQSPQQLDFHLDGKRQLVQVTPFQDGRNLDWLIVVVVPESDFMEQINANTRTTILLCIVTLIVAIIIGILITSWVTKPLIQLNSAAKDMAEGKWDKTVDIERADEVGQLAKSFNYMARQLKGSFTELNAVISQAKQVGVEVTSSTTQIAAASRQLEATVTSQSVSVQEVSATAKVIAATSEELVQTMDNINQKAQATAFAATNSQADLTEMAVAMRQLADATTTISSRLEIMNERANNINVVVTTITKVADLTNLLSLNATIEAEKAGQYGAGFAVVAREIQRLAEQTAVATLEIEQMVRGIQSSVANGVTEMNKFSEEVSHNVEQVGQICRQIASTISQVQSLTPHFEEVSHSMERQSGDAQQISVAIARLSEASQQTVESLHDTNRTLARLDDTTQVLQKIISRSQVD